jgi:transposase
MSRYRLTPTPEQGIVLAQHCAHARYVWNLAVEQQSWWRHGRGSPPRYSEQAAQLTEARAEFGWLREGSQTVQQQALRDFAQAMANYFSDTHRRPTWRKQGRDEGFRIVAVKTGHIRRLSRKLGQVWIPKAGWVRFRWSRAVPEAKSYRVTCDRAGRWHIAFAAVPQPIPGQPIPGQPIPGLGSGEVVGIDRGVVVSAEGDRRKDWAEQVSTGPARRFDVIRIEDLRITGMTRSAKGTLAQPGRGVRQKAGLNRGILSSGWGLLARRFEDKAPDRVERINPAYTSQRCSACGHVAADSRESQALFRCAACGYACHAGVDAARNTAAGHAVAARGRSPLGGRVNREPQLLTSQTVGAGQ